MEPIHFLTFEFIDFPWFFTRRIEKTFSYFDTIGRPTVIVECDNYYPFFTFGFLKVFMLLILDQVYLYTVGSV